MGVYEGVDGLEDLSERHIMLALEAALAFEPGLQVIAAEFPEIEVLASRGILSAAPQTAGGLVRLLPGRQFPSFPSSFRRAKASAHFRTGLRSGPITVWRMQNGYGRGPYTDAEDISPKLEELLFENSMEWPSPAQEGIPRWGRLLSGFVSQEQATAWFNALELQMLAEAGYRIVEREAAVVFFGDRQVGFLPWR